MRPKFDDHLSTLLAVMHYKFDRYDPDWPDLYATVVADSMLRTFEVLGLAERTRDENGQTVWSATPELKRLSGRHGDFKQVSKPATGNEAGVHEAGATRGIAPGRD
jgi:hypothetical protein